MKGTYVAVEPFHLDRYVTKQVFRYNNRVTTKRSMSDGDRFSLAVSQTVGKRLTYAEHDAFLTYPMVILFLRSRAA